MLSQVNIANILKVVLFACLAAGVCLLSLRYIESRTLFYPTKDVAFNPRSVNLEFQDVFFTTDDNVELNGWLVLREGAVYTVLFCHGNAGNLSHRIEKLKFFHELGCNVFIFDYRGYGKSKGSPSEKGFYKDIKAAYKFLLSCGISVDQIVGYGESIGGAVIVDLASKETIRAMILDSTLTSVKAMIARAYPFVPYWVFSSRFASDDKIKLINIPKLIIHSRNDEIIPYAIGKKLYEVSCPPKEFVEIQGGHNSCFYESRDFLKKKIGDFILSLKKDQDVDIL